jgi:hypothetical protein
VLTQELSLMPASLQIRWVAGQVDDLVLRRSGHGRARDRSGEPVPGLDGLVLGSLVRLGG